MKSAAFGYHLPDSVQAALSLLAELSPDGGRVLAGGQSLVPMMAFRLTTPAHLIDINRLTALQGCRVADGRLTIGAVTRHAAFARPVAGTAAPGPLGALLREVGRHIAHQPIRTRGTFGGSLAHADPASEWCLTLATLGGTVRAGSVAGERRIAAADFFAGIMTTTLRENEMLLDVAMELLPDDTRFGFHETSRRAGDYALSMTLATGRVAGGRLAEVRVGVGGAEATPRRISAAEAVLEGAAPGPALFIAAAEAAAAAVEPMEDAQADAPFRRALVRATTRRALIQAFG